MPEPDGPGPPDHPHCLPTGRDPGPGPSENFMDDSDYPCMNHFTAGQAARMNVLFDACRLRR
jgi:hypothetical protein